MDALSPMEDPTPEARASGQQGPILQNVFVAIDGAIKWATARFCSVSVDDTYKLVAFN